MITLAKLVAQPVYALGLGLQVEPGPSKFALPVHASL